MEEPQSAQAQPEDPDVCVGIPTASHSEITAPPPSDRLHPGQPDSARPSIKKKRLLLQSPPVHWKERFSLAHLNIVTVVVSFTEMAFRHSSFFSVCNAFVKPSAVFVLVGSLTTVNFLLVFRLKPQESVLLSAFPLPSPPSLSLSPPLLSHSHSHPHPPTLSSFPSLIMLAIPPLILASLPRFHSSSLCSPPLLLSTVRSCLVSYFLTVQKLALQTQFP